jgi:hypothetical protein
MVSGAIPDVLFEVKFAPGNSSIGVCFELDEPDRLEKLVSFIVEISADAIIGGVLGFAVAPIPSAPVFGNPAGCATYCSGSVGISVMDGSIAGLGVVDRKAHPLELTKMTMRRHATTPGLYIDNFEFL